MIPFLAPLFLLPEPERDKPENALSRQKLVSASERLRVPTPTERLLKG